MKLVASLFALFAASASAQTEIVGGKEAKISQHLYVSSLRFTPGGSTFCGGSLIAPNVILTAAHCSRPTLQYVSIGSHYTNGTQDGEQIKIKQQIVHPKYKRETASHDFAIFLLEKNSKYAPVDVSFDEVPGGVPTVVRGWGDVEDGGDDSYVLLEVGVDSLTNKRCKELYEPKYTVDDSMLCAGGEQGKDSCQGDSGGPLTIETNGTAKLVGVVSWGDGCAVKNQPGVYGRISYVRDFIEPYLVKKQC